MNDLPTWIGLAMGITSFIAGAIAWYRGSVEKSYAAQRSFEHLRRNQEQMSTALSQVMDEIEVVENATSNQLGTLNDIRQSLNILSHQLTEVKTIVMASRRHEN